jgi:tRNA nucleotidyltransferase (CCA-adding enzyme)
MAVSIDNEIIDLFGGISDLENRIIRCVGDPASRFDEDALRMFRAYRFSAELGFTIEQETLRAIHASADRAALISAERIRVELEKTLLSPKPEVAVEMIKSGLLGKYLKQDNTSETKPQSPCTVREQPHNTKGKQETVAPVLNCASCIVNCELQSKTALVSSLPAEPALRWCAFCAVLLDAGLIDSAAKFLRGLRLDGKTIRACSAASSITGFPASRTGIKHLLAKYGALAVRCAAASFDIKHARQGDDFSAWREADEPPHCLARTDEVIASGECFSLSSLAINGSDLISQGHAAGMELGETLQSLLRHVIEHPGDNNREALLEAAKTIIVSVQ